MFTLGPPPGAQDMFKLVHYVALTVDKRAVDIWLKYPFVHFTVDRLSISLEKLRASRKLIWQFCVTQNFSLRIRGIILFYLYFVIIDFIFANCCWLKLDWRSQKRTFKPKGTLMFLIKKIKIFLFLASRVELCMFSICSSNFRKSV